MTVFILYGVFLASALGIGHAHFVHCIYYQGKRGDINSEWWFKFTAAVFFTLVPFFLFDYNVAIALSMIVTIFHDYTDAFFLDNLKQNITDKIQCWLVVVSALSLVMTNMAYQPGGFETAMSFYLSFLALVIGCVFSRKYGSTALMNTTIPWFVGLLVISSSQLANLTWLPVIMVSNMIHFIRWYIYSYRKFENKRSFFIEGSLLTGSFFLIVLLFLFPGFIVALATDFDGLQWVIMELALTANIHTFTTSRWFNSKSRLRVERLNCLDTCIKE